MGLPRLMTHILTNKDTCVVSHDLVEVAKKNGGIEILVDYYCFRRFIHSKFHHYLTATSGNGDLIIIGAENNILERYVTTFIQSLAVADVTLVWFVDCAKGGSVRQHQEKYKKWCSQYCFEIQAIHSTIQICEGKTEPSDLGNAYDLCMPVLWDTALRDVIVKNCEVIHCPTSDADYPIAVAMKERTNAFAILSNDADFAIFQNTPFIPNALFDLENDLHMEDADMFSDPQRVLDKLVVGVVTAEQVSKSFKFPSPDVMIDLSVIKGNNFTYDFVQRSRLWVHVKCPGNHNLLDLAQFLARHGRLSKNKKIEEFTRRWDQSLEFMRRLTQSYSHYMLDLQDDTLREPSELLQLIVKHIRANVFPSDVLAIHNEVYWRRLIVEKHLSHHPCIEAILTPLRRHMYELCLPHGVDVVTEYGRDIRSRYPDQFYYSIEEVFSRKNKLDMIQVDEKQKNLKIFRRIMNHMFHEPESLARLKEARDRGQRGGDFLSYSFNPSEGLIDEEEIRQDDYVELYGDRDGFVLTILRYFLLLNWQQNLHLEAKVILALVAVALREPDDEKYQKLMTRPTADAVTIANWFLDVYRHAYEYIASILHLKDYFPLPKDIFCGSAWVAFYTATITEEQDEMLTEAREEMVNVLQTHRDQVQLLTRDYFSFDETLILVTQDQFVNLGF